ncbi:MAG: BamA/TamA family outer membrane protein [Ignavibacteria bacterium]|nr:BamA/TamA family outer membrane protein [Ignavibacteria bacterium]
MKRFVKKIFLLLIIVELFTTLSFSQDNFVFQFQSPSVQKEFLKFFEENKSLSTKNIDTIYTYLKIFLEQNGFVEGEIVIDTSESFSDKVIKVNEGKRYVVQSINFLRDTLNQKQIEKLISIFKGTPLNQKLVNNISTQIIDMLEKDGYPFAQIQFFSYRVIDENEEEKFVELIFNLEKNKSSTINRIEIKGNKFTSRSAIIREMRIGEGELFTPDLSKKILLRLNRLNIFSSVMEPQFYFDENMNGVLEIEVKEGNTNSFDGIIGYVPSQNPKEKGYVTGQVNVSLRNLFGTLRAFAFRWNRIDRFSQDLEIKYFEPWFLGLPLNIQPTFRQFKQDTTFFQRTFTGNFDLQFSENFAFTLSLSSTSVIPQLNYAVVNVNRSSSISYGLGVIYDSRDHPVYTKSGLLFKTDVNHILKRDYLSLGTKKYNQQKVNFSFSIFQLLFRNQLIYFSINTKVINGDGISISDLFRFGGMNSLRGYVENQFTGSRILWSNFEYRFLTSYTDYISAFFDYGYYYRDILNEKVSKFKYGYGFGAAFQTPLGLLKVNFALGEGDTFSRGKIHFGIVSGF